MFRCYRQPPPDSPAAACRWICACLWRPFLSVNAVRACHAPHLPCPPRHAPRPCACRLSCPFDLFTCPTSACLAAFDLPPAPGAPPLCTVSTAPACLLSVCPTPAGRSPGSPPDPAGTLRPRCAKRARPSRSFPHCSLKTWYNRRWCPWRCF